MQSRGDEDKKAFLDYDMESANKPVIEGGPG
jgi:hypothetical protein